MRRFSIAVVLVAVSASWVAAERLIPEKVLVWPSPRYGNDRLIVEILEQMGVPALVGARRDLDPFAEPMIILPSNAAEQRDLTMEAVKRYLRGGGLILSFHGGAKGWMPWGMLHRQRMGVRAFDANFDDAPFAKPYRLWPVDVYGCWDIHHRRCLSWFSCLTHLPDYGKVLARNAYGEALLVDIAYGDGVFLYTSFYPDLLHQMDPCRNWPARRFLVNLLVWALSRSGVWQPTIPRDVTTAKPKAPARRPRSSRRRGAGDAPPPATGLGKN